jgi:hypothetical protein
LSETPSTGDTNAGSTQGQRQSRCGGCSAKHAHVKQADAQKFVDWITSAAGQATVADYKIGGEQLFFPNAAK